MDEGYRYADPIAPVLIAYYSDAEESKDGDRLQEGRGSMIKEWPRQAHDRKVAFPNIDSVRGGGNTLTEEFSQRASFSREKTGRKRFG